MLYNEDRKKPIKQEKADQKEQEDQSKEVRKMLQVELESDTKIPSDEDEMNGKFKLYSSDYASIATWNCRLRTR